MVHKILNLKFQILDIEKKSFQEPFSGSDSDSDNIPKQKINIRKYPFILDCIEEKKLVI